MHKHFVLNELCELSGYKLQAHVVIAPPRLQRHAFHECAN